LIAGTRSRHMGWSTPPRQGATGVIQGAAPKFAAP
jgi:hypothetical protein